MGSVRPGIPLTLVTRLKEALGLTFAVETGTYFGESAIALADQFEHVWTIELSESLWKRALENHADVSNVTFMNGSSDKVIGDVEVSGPTLYWLDGHWSAGVTAGELNQCPVLEEIRAIDRMPAGGQSALLIDDARHFLAPPGPPMAREQWPSIAQVFDELRARHDRYVTIVEDVVVAVPKQAQRLVEDYGMSVSWQPPPPSPARRAHALAKGIGRRLTRR